MPMLVPTYHHHHQVLPTHSPPLSSDASNTIKIDAQHRQRNHCCHNSMHSLPLQSTHNTANATIVTQSNTSNAINNNAQHHQNNHHHHNWTHSLPLPLMLSTANAMPLPPHHLCQCNTTANATHYATATAPPLPMQHHHQCNTASTLPLPMLCHCHCSTTAEAMPPSTQHGQHIAPAVAKHSAWPGTDTHNSQPVVMRLSSASHS
jgi:hypothetical protein